MVYIIVKNKPSSRQEKYFVVRTPAQAARSIVSKENRQEYDNEKRAKEISKKMKSSCPEYNAAAVAKMMGIDEKKAKKLITKKSKGVILDGRID